MNKTSSTHQNVSVRRYYITAYVNDNQPVTLKSVAEHLHSHRHTIPAASSNEEKCYQTTSKDLQILRRKGAIAPNAVIFKDWA